MGWVWLLANGLQAWQKFSERNAKLAALEVELTKTTGSKEEARIRKRIKEISGERIVLDAGANVPFV